MIALTTDLPAEPVADEHPGDDRAHHGVDEATTTETPERQLQRGHGLRVGDRLPEAARRPRSPSRRPPPAAAGRSGSGTRSTSPEADAPGARDGAPARGSALRRGRLARQPPFAARSWSRSRCRGSKNRLSTFAQPPSHLIVNSAGRDRERELLRRALQRPAGSRSRAKIFCAGVVRR